jgi:hypothetical protein
MRACFDRGSGRGLRCGREERSSRPFHDLRASSGASRQRRHHLQAVVAETPRRLTASLHELPASMSATTPRLPASPEACVTVKPHPGPPSVEPSQTQNLEGGADDLLSRPQRVEVRRLGRADGPVSVCKRAHARGRAAGRGDVSTREAAAQRELRIRSDRVRAAGCDVVESVVVDAR